MVAEVSWQNSSANAVQRRRCDTVTWPLRHSSAGPVARQPITLEVSVYVVVVPVGVRVVSGGRSWCCWCRVAYVQVCLKKTKKDLRAWAVPMEIV